MDIGMREILIVLGCLIMAVLFIDAYRRVRDHRRSQLGHRLNDQHGFTSQGLDGFDDDEFEQAPLTPVRPVAQRDGPIGQGVRGSAKEPERHLDETFFDSAPAMKKPSSKNQNTRGAPSQIRVRISSPKNESHQPQSPSRNTVPNTPKNPSLAASLAQDTPVKVKAPMSPSEEVAARLPQRSLGRKTQADDLFAAQATKSDTPIKALLQPALAAAPESGDFYSNRRRSQAAISARKEQERAQAQAPASAPEKAPQDVIVMHLVASETDVFDGEILVQELLALNLRHGDMKIFHRFERPEQHQGILFSMANLVKPGYFELDHMNAFETPGVTFFLTLPCTSGGLYAFDLMVDTGRKLAKKLGGVLRDETHSMITAQTVEHYRQRVMEFERKQRMLEKTRQIRERSKLFE